MAIRDIVLYPDEALREKCKPVSDVTSPEIQKLIDDMVDTMYDAPGVGLAAPQVGVPYRITVIDVRDEDDERGVLHVLINPQIISRSGKIVWQEGCLSIPGVFADVQRSNKVRVRAIGRDGEPFEFDAEELFAVCVQHEIDHLDGVLFLDHLSRLKLRVAMKTYKRTLPEYITERDEKKQKRLEAAQASSEAAESP